jgi:iron complex transport system substrate-binding protein
MRICTFLPSATEIVYALGLGDSLFGVSHECDYPSEARDKPKVVRSKFDPALYSSQDIHRLVADFTARGERIYEVDLDVLREAKPDFVITQQLCDVCAVSFEDVQQAVVHLDLPPQLISLDPMGLEGVLEDIERVGEFVRRKPQAQRIVARLRREVEDVKARAARSGSRPRVACIEWLDPLIVAGHWIPEMVGLSGGVDVLGKPGESSRRIEMRELAESGPDVLILMPCGMSVDRAAQEFSRLGGLDRWKALPAVRGGKVYATDASGLFSRSGPRLVEGLQLMGQMIHPEVFTDPLPAEAARRLGTLPVPS